MMLPSFQAPYTPGQEMWYPAGAINATALATQTLTINRLYAVPQFFPRETHLDKIGIAVTTGSAGNARVGIWECSLTGFYPGHLIYDSGDLVTTSIAVVTTACCIRLKAQTVYFFGLVSNAAAVVRGVAQGAMSPVYGLNTAMTALSTHLFIAYTYAPLPSLFPTGASPSGLLSMPCVGFRVVGVPTTGGAS